MMVWIASGLYVFILVSITAGVIWRYFLHKPLDWVSDLADFSLVYFVFLGSVWLQKKDRHVKLNIIIDRVSRRVQNVLSIVISAVCAIMFLLYAYYGFWITQKHFISGSYTVGSTLEIHDAFWIGIIPVAFFMIALLMIRTVWLYFKPLFSSSAKRKSGTQARSEKN